MSKKKNGVKKPLALKLLGVMAALLALWGILVSVFFTTNIKDTFLNASSRLIDEVEGHLTETSSRQIEQTKELLIAANENITEAYEKQIADIPFSLYKGDENRIKEAITQEVTAVQERSTEALVILAEAMAKESAQTNREEIKKLKQDQVKESEILARKMQLGLGVFLVFALIVLAFVKGYWIRKVIIAPVNKLMAATQEIAKGNFTHPIELKSKDELGQLASSFNKMTEDLHRTTASRDELDVANRQLKDEIVGRKLAEEAVLETNLQLEEVVERTNEMALETELARIELNQIFQTAADGMRVVDKEFTVLRINEAFAMLSGKTETESVGKKCYEGFHGAMCDTSQCPLRRILGGEDRIECEVEKERPDGTKLPCLAAATPFRGPHGNLMGIVESFKDMTESKRIEEERVQREKLEGVIEMAGAVCHELNQPMQAVSGFSELLMMEMPEDSNSKENFEEIKQQIDRMGKITKKLMRITKYETKDYVYDGKKIIDIDKASERVDEVE